jgi:hypothetical protein
MENAKITAENAKITAANAQAQLFNQMVLQGRDLQWKFMDLFFNERDDDEIKKRREMFMGMLIGYHSSCFELRNVLAIPPSVIKLMDADLKELFRQAVMRKKWEDIQNMYSKEFIQHDNSLKGV